MYIIKEIAAAGVRAVVKAEKNDGSGELITFTVGREFLAPFAVSEGDEIDEETAEELEDAEKKTYAVSKALDALSFGNLSRSALARKLRIKYGTEKKHADFAADYAVLHGYIDEKHQAERIAELCVRTKKWGKRRIVSDLISKGYPKNVAECAADSVNDADYEAALRSLVEKKAGSRSPDRDELKKTAASVIRLGYSPSEVLREIERYLSRYF